MEGGEAVGVVVREGYEGGDGLVEPGHAFAYPAQVGIAAGEGMPDGVVEEGIHGGKVGKVNG